MCSPRSSPSVPNLITHPNSEYPPKQLDPTDPTYRVPRPFQRPNPNLRSIVSPLLVTAPELDQPARADHVPAAQQRRDVDVERAVRLGVPEQHAHGAHALEHAVGGGPGVLEQIEADLARLQRDVGVDDGRGKGHLGGLERIRRGKGDLEKPTAICAARAR